MSDPIEIAIEEPYSTMIRELREELEGDVDADIKRVVCDAVHNSYQELHTLE
jgi:8-oxo-dGTP pyrophosphatase MutT (NUDIX family)